MEDLANRFPCVQGGLGRIICGPCMLRSCQADKLTPLPQQSIPVVYSIPSTDSSLESETHTEQFMLQRGKRIMDDIIRRSIQLIEQKKKSSVPWQPDTACDQPYYTFVNDEWKPQRVSLSNHSLSSSSGLQKLALYSWNIDFMLPFGESRMRAAISHLKHLVTIAPDQNSTATVIYFQECVTKDLEIMAADEWIREKFALTDIGNNNWASGHYGTVSLIDRRLPISSCFRVHFSRTRMERDGLFVDVTIQDKNIRLCNTHLESLALEPPFRIPQMQVCAEYMRKPGVHAALLAGDLNAIQPFDHTLHTDNGLKDAYLELGGREDDAAGHTWGQQAAASQRERFGTSRMDKVYFCGDLELLAFEKFGADVLVEDQAEQEQLVGLGFDAPWVTDHLGVKAVVRIPGKPHPSGVM